MKARTMKFTVNAREKEITVLYGASVIFTYEAVVKHADKSSDKNYTVTYKSGDKQGSLTKGESVTIKIGDPLIFSVADTSNA